MKTSEYRGYRIVFNNGIVGQPHPQAGKYLAQEFSIGFMENGAYTEQQYIPESLFYDTEAEAEAATLRRAKRIIEDKYL